MKDKIIPAVGLILGAMVWFFIGAHYGSSIKTTDMIDLYERGKEEALKISPRPSIELELTCANIWAGRAPAPRVLQ